MAIHIFTIIFILCVDTTITILYTKYGKFVSWCLGGGEIYLLIS